VFWSLKTVADEVLDFAVSIADRTHVGAMKTLIVEVLVPLMAPDFPPATKGTDVEGVLRQAIY
jgi:hypothetical protein